LTEHPRSAGGVLRKIIAVLILVPLAIILTAFAVANRHLVTVSLDPFNPSAPAASVTLPLFALVFVLLILGVLIGGTAGWLRHGGRRRAVQRLERDLAALHAEVQVLKTGPHGPPSVPAATNPPERLKLQAPVR
jgi:uncharacterized integral membrane protein